MFNSYFTVLFAYALFSVCKSSTLVMNVVEFSSYEEATLVCNVPSSTNLTRWTYLFGPTSTSLMSFQNGRCTLSNDLLYKIFRGFSYTCNSTVHQVTFYPNGINIKNYILACRDAVQPDGTGSTWMIRIIEEEYQCNCDQTMTFNIREITEGDNVTFICRVSSDVPNVNWNKLGSNAASMIGQNGHCTTSPYGTTFLDNISKYIYTCNRTVYQVTILNVQRSEHNDMYLCKPYNQTEGTESKWIIKVKAPVTSVTMSPANSLVNVKENSAVEFTCTTSTARPVASVYWYIHRNGNSNDITRIVDSITTTTDFNDLSVITSTLQFIPTRQHNDMKIYCETNNSVNTSPVKSSTILLNTQYPPAILPMNDIAKLKYEQFNLMCNYTTGMPEITSIKWMRDIDDRVWNTAALNIESLESSDTGIYTCTASNIMKQSGDNTSYIGQHNQSFHLDVQYAASITSFTIDGYSSQTVTVNESDPVRFICTANSNPTAVMTVRHESKTLVTVTLNNIEYNIAEASCSDEGIFYCSARNIHHESTDILQLFVNCTDIPSPIPGPLIGSITGGVTGCIIIVVVIIFIIRRYSLSSNNEAEEQAKYSTGRVEDVTIENNDATAFDEIGSVTNANNNSAAEDAIQSSVNNYEMVNLNTRESKPYSTLDQTEQRTAPDTTSGENKSEYENMKIGVF